MVAALALAPALLRAQATPSRDTAAAPRPAESRGAADSLARLDPDSLAARLERAEAAIALLRQQLATENATRVQTRRRVQLELSARVLTNVFANSRRVNNVDVPLFVLPDAEPVAGVGSPGDNTLGLSLRQSMVGAAFTVEEVLGATFEGDLDLDFFGRGQAGPGDRLLFPEPRLRTARGALRWARTELMVGQEEPLISDLDPASLASVGFPGFVGAGNLWNWFPQIRLSQEIGAVGVGARRVRFGAQGAVLTPFSTERHPAEPDAVDAGERSGRPYLEARVRARWGGEDDEERTSEVGVSAHRGWVAAVGDRLLASEAIAADARLWLGRWLELRGEAYRGQLLRGLGGGGIGQDFGRAAAPGAPVPVLRDVAAWGQVVVHPLEVLSAGAGCGVDDPRDRDRPLRRRNSVCAAHLLWRPAGTLVAGLEYRRLSTLYQSGRYRNDHLNLALGFEL